jgi:hypothetical protein
MVDKRSLRSSKRTDDNNKNNDSSSSNNKPPSKSTRSSSRRTASGASKKTPVTENTEKTTEADKQPEPPVEDTQMGDVQEPKKDLSGDVEMGDDTIEKKEDPAVTTYNGMLAPPCYD